MFIVELPIAWAASILPASTSFNEDSTILAIYGAAATIKGTSIAVVPIEVPTIILVKGILLCIDIVKYSDKPNVRKEKLRAFLYLVAVILSIGLLNTCFGLITGLFWFSNW